MLKQFMTILAPALLSLAVPAWADDCSQAVTRFKNAGQSGKLVQSAYGYAVFPTIGKAGFGVGGAHGKGCVYQQGKHIGDASMTQVTVGFQAGAEGYSEIILFEDERALKEFTSGNFEFGADAHATVITAAAGGEASTTGASAGASGGKNDAKNVGKYYKGMATFTIVKGAMPL